MTGLELGGLMLLVAGSFAATNVDNLILLVVLMGAEPSRRVSVVLGFLSAAACVLVIATLGALVGTGLDPALLGYFGLVPLGFGIVLPVMPRQAEPYLNAVGASPLAAGGVIGLLFSVFSLMQFIFSPILGRLSDRYGRRPLLILSLLGSVVFYALYGFAVSLPATQARLALGLMLASRIGAGIAGASVGTAAPTRRPSTARSISMATLR